MRTIVAAALAAHRLDPPLHRVLCEQIPRVGKLQKLAQFSGENFTLFKSYLEAHRGEVTVEDLELASFVCVTAIESLTHNAVLHEPKRLAGQGAERLVEQITRLVTGYLLGQPAPTGAISGAGPGSHR